MQEIAWQARQLAAELGLGLVEAVEGSQPRPQQTQPQQGQGQLDKHRLRVRLLL